MRPNVYVLDCSYWHVSARGHTTFSILIMFFYFAARRGVIFDEEAAMTKCDSQFTTVTLHRSRFPWLDIARMHIHLNDPLCKPSHVDNEHVRFKIPVGSCGSRHIRSPTEVTFTNRVLILEESRGSYKEKEVKTLMKVYFLCRYRRINSRNESVSERRLLK